MVKDSKKLKGRLGWKKYSNIHLAIITLEIFIYRQSTIQSLVLKSFIDL